MIPILEALRSGTVLLMDGAMGTELYQAGLEQGSCGELWNLTRPERVRAIHRSYRESGADCVLTNTFQSNPAALLRHGLEEQLDEINAAAVRLARAAVGRQGYVLADIGVLGGTDGDEFPFWDELAQVVDSFSTVPGMRGVDALLLETCSTPRALSAVEFIRRRVLNYDDQPIFLSLTYRCTGSGRLVTFSGHSPETFARHAEQHGVAALGVNCGSGIGPEECVEIIRRYRRVTDLPLFARPNAGTPIHHEGHLEYPLTPADLAAQVPALIEAGVNMLGGCCGTTPAHIGALRSALVQASSEH